MLARRLLARQVGAAVGRARWYSDAGTPKPKSGNAAMHGQAGKAAAAVDAAKAPARAIETVKPAAAATECATPKSHESPLSESAEAPVSESPKEEPQPASSGLLDHLKTLAKGSEPPAPAPAPSESWLESFRSLSPSAEGGTFDERTWASTVVRGRAIHEPLYHPRTHGVPVALLHLRAHEPAQLDLFVHFASHAACALGIPISRPARLPTQRSLWTVPRGPFVHKKAQENFERRVHKRCVKAWDAEGAVVEAWVAYLRRHALPGVGVRVVRWERARVGVGREVLASVEAGLRGTERGRMERLGEEIVKRELEAGGQVQA